MPSPLDYLDRLAKGDPSLGNPVAQALNTPLVPQKAIQPVQDYLEKPQLDQSPLKAGLKGFASGALEGLRGFTSPLGLANLGIMASPWGGAARMAEALPEAVQGLSRAIPEVVEAGEGIRQVMPTAQDASDLIGALKYRLAKVPTSAAKQGENTIAAMSKVGPQPGAPTGIVPLGPSQVEMQERLYQQANPAFQKLQQSGAFGGDRSVGGIGGIR